MFSSFFFFFYPLKEQAIECCTKANFKASSILDTSDDHSLKGQHCKDGLQLVSGAIFYISIPQSWTEFTDYDMSTEMCWFYFHISV